MVNTSIFIANATDLQVVFDPNFNETRLLLR